MPRMVKCAKLSRELPAIPYKPFNNELGQRIYDSISMEAWKGWLEFSKMIVNEYRLDLTSPQGQKMLHEQAEKYFFGEGAQLPPDYVAPPRSSRRRSAGRSGSADRIERQPCADRATSFSSRATSPVTSRRAWRRRSRSCAAPVSSRRRSTWRSSRWTTRRARAWRPRGSWRSRSRCTRRWCSGRRVAAHVRRANPRAHLCIFGMYATLNRALLAGEADSVLGPDCELQLVELAAVAGERGPPCRVAPRPPGRQPALVPDRGALPALGKYARLAIAGEQRIAGHVEATRGCKHLCRHCPIPPVYEGRFYRGAGGRRAGGCARADRRGRAPHRLRRSRFPQRSAARAARSRRRCTPSTRRVTFSFTAKVEHIVAQQRADPRAGGGGRAVRRQRRRIAVRPRPRRAGEGPPRGRRAARAGDRARRRPVAAADVRRVHALDDAGRLSGPLPVHPRPRAGGGGRPGAASLRLLVPPGSPLLRRPTSRRFWAARRGGAQLPVDAPRSAHGPPRGRGRGAGRGGRAATASRRRPPSRRIHRLAATAAGLPDEAPAQNRIGLRPRREPPHLTESWFCCAQPTRRQLGAV